MMRSFTQAHQQDNPLVDHHRQSARESLDPLQMMISGQQLQGEEEL